MKQCPACRTTYPDDSLSFCLSDGVPLVDAAEEEPTVVRGAAKDPMRVDIPRPSDPSVARRPEPPGTEASALWLKVLVALIVLGIAAIAVVGLLGAVFYYGMGPGVPSPTPPPVAPTPGPTAIATVDPEKERLRDELANIQKRLDEQKKNANTWDPNDDYDERGSSITATVDSPSDGFLALRSLPDADRGERLAKIPHGSEVEILNCEKTAVTIGGRSGRWCQVEHDGRNGWVFDAWLEY